MFVRLKAPRAWRLGLVSRGGAAANGADSEYLPAFPNVVTHDIDSLVLKVSCSAISSASI